jgi:glycerophosphoryl diester phosphodiesterase
VIVLGHRGGRGEGWPQENTLAAFRRAMEEGADGVELDVRPCKDGIVVFHDATLERVHGMPRRVADVTARELAELGVPTLEEALAAVKGTVNVELKRDVPDRVSFARTAARLVGKDHIVSSFDPFMLGVLVRFPFRRALLTHATQKSAPGLLALARPPLVTGVHLERTQASLVPAMKRRGLSVGVWTVNDALEARDLEAQGVDVLITDRPAIIRRAPR